MHLKKTNNDRLIEGAIFDVDGTLLDTMMITVSSVVGSLFGGIILDVSGPRMLTLLATVTAAAGTVIIIAMVDKVNGKE